jgi:hypothetical protein
MANNNSLQDIFEKYRFDRNISKKSSAWFSQQALLLSKKGITPNKILKNDPSAAKTTIVPGNMYLFMYDAKLKETLPHWDKFPLVFPFKAVKGGFYGLNLHYLPYRLRAILMDRLLQFKNNSKFDETTRLKYSWDLISSASKFNLAKPCVKHYLMTQVRSPFVKINSEDWTTALMLPVERFVGATSSSVWAETKKAGR